MKVFRSDWQKDLKSDYMTDRRRRRELGLAPQLLDRRPGAIITLTKTSNPGWGDFQVCKSRSTDHHIYYDQRDRTNYE